MGERQIAGQEIYHRSRSNIKVKVSKLLVWASYKQLRQVWRAFNEFVAIGMGSLVYYSANLDDPSLDTELPGHILELPSKVVERGGQGAWRSFERVHRQILLAIICGTQLGRGGNLHR